LASKEESAVKEAVGQVLRYQAFLTLMKKTRKMKQGFGQQPIRKSRSLTQLHRETYGKGEAIMFIVERYVAKWLVTLMTMALLQSAFYVIVET
jgi:hypothetical protein